MRVAPSWSAWKTALLGVVLGMSFVGAGTLPGSSVARADGRTDVKAARVEQPAVASQVSTTVVTLELWTWALRPWFNAYMAEMLAAFERENPGVKVHWVDVPGDTLVRKFFAAGAAGKLPDVVNLADKTFLRFANLGALQPLDGILPGDPEKVYVGAALEQCRLDGKLYGLPNYLSTEISVMNTQLLAEGGLTPATVGKTWDELLEQAGAFRAKTGKYLFILRLGEVDLLSMVTAAGLKPIVKDESGGYRSNLADPAVVGVVEKWVKAYRDGELPRESATADYPAVVQAFKEQSVAILNADAVRSVRADAPKVYEKLAVGPGITGAIGKTNVSAVYLGVSSQSRHPQLAAKLLWFMTSPRWAEKLCMQASRVPGTIESLEKPEFSRPADESDKLKLAIGIGAEQLKLGRAQSFIPPTGKWPDMEDAFGDELKRSLLEGVPVKQSLERVSRVWDNMLREERELASQK